jgi:hypothetical protein
MAREKACGRRSAEPSPVQQPLPVWIDGGERSIEHAARYASALMTLDMTPSAARLLRSRIDEAPPARGGLWSNYLAGFADPHSERKLRPSDPASDGV